MNDIIIQGRLKELRYFFLYSVVLSSAVVTLYLLSCRNVTERTLYNVLQNNKTVFPLEKNASADVTLF